MQKLAYQAFIVLYPFVARILAPFSPKVRQWLAGRRNWQAWWKQACLEAGIGSGNNRVVWMHAASLGEFEQGSPLLEAIRTDYPDIKIVVTFFSPSGYEVRKNYAGADVVGYLPMDSAANARQFVAMLQPSLVLWVKYEYWYHYLNTLQQQNIPIFLVSGIFRTSQPFFSWYGSLHRKMLGCFDMLFVQNQASADLIDPLIPAKKIVVAGDTRFDRVVQVANNWQPIPLVEQWLGTAGQVVVAGSTWPGDEEELVHYTKSNPGVKWIIAPHHIDGQMMADTLKLFQHPATYSLLASGVAQMPAGNVLIIDNVGMLSRLYKYGHLCYVGGGFTGDGVHNVLEAAVYGRPVLHGPEYSKYAEAIGLVETEGSRVIDSALSLEETLSYLWQHEEERQLMGEKAGRFVQWHAGATGTIMRYVHENLRRTSK